MKKSILAMAVLAVMGINLESALASKGGGNGGVSVVCRDQAGTIKSAEILDVYEGRMYGQIYKNEAVNVESKINLTLSKLSKYPNYRKSLQDEIADAKLKVIFIPYHNDLKPTNDAFPIISKRGCKFEQLANYTDEGDLLVSQEIYDKLDVTNKAALYVHEAIYVLRRKLGDKDSQISRKIVSKLMASNVNQRVIDELVIKHTNSDAFIRGKSSFKKIVVLEANTNGEFKTEEYENGSLVRTVSFIPYNEDKTIFISKERYYDNLHVYIKFLDSNSMIYTNELRYFDGQIVESLIWKRR